MSENSQNFSLSASMLPADGHTEETAMQIPRDEAERVQFFITLGQQPGVGAWFSVWLVSRSKRLRRPDAKAEKKLPSQACTA